ncbi:MAG TPA: hypothetical protein VLM79_03840, partial [Kofleriaceae bacterium]|nr:hypothetical protein [Kofleriaceae bacterium]
RQHRDLAGGLADALADRRAGDIADRLGHGVVGGLAAIDRGAVDAAPIDAGAVDLAAITIGAERVLAVAAHGAVLGAGAPTAGAVLGARAPTATTLRAGSTTATGAIVAIATGRAVIATGRAVITAAIALAVDRIEAALYRFVVVLAHRAHRAQSHAIRPAGER